MYRFGEETYFAAQICLCGYIVSWLCLVLAAEVLSNCTSLNGNMIKVTVAA